MGQGRSADAGLSRGVVESPVTDLLEAFEYGRVMRHPDIGAIQQMVVAKRARDFVGYGYAELDAIGLSTRRKVVRAAHPPKRDRPRLARLGEWLTTWHAALPTHVDRIYCSQSVLDAYATAGFSLSTLADAPTTPSDFADNGDFAHVGWLTRHAQPRLHPMDRHSPQRLGGHRGSGPGLWRALTGHGGDPGGRDEPS